MADLRIGSVLSLAIRESLRAWPTIKIAQAHGFGGENIQEKIEWLGESILQIFNDNEIVYPDELEDYVGEVLYNEFDTLVEDGSLRKLAETMCRYYSWLKTGNEVKILEEINQLANLPTPSVHCMSTDDSMIVAGDNERDHETPQLNCVDENDLTTNNHHHDLNINTSDMDVDDDRNISNETNDDGWQIVKRNKGKKNK